MNIKKIVHVFANEEDAQEMILNVGMFMIFIPYMFLQSVRAYYPIIALRLHHEVHLLDSIPRIDCKRRNLANVIRNFGIVYKTIGLSSLRILLKINTNKIRRQNMNLF
jgi:hypothetical protein